MYVTTALPLHTLHISTDHQPLRTSECEQSLTLISATGASPAPCDELQEEEVRPQQPAPPEEEAEVDIFAGSYVLEGMLHSGVSSCLMVE
jgi:hypothetical protein